MNKTLFRIFRYDAIMFWRMNWKGYLLWWLTLFLIIMLLTNMKNGAAGSSGWDLLIQLFGGFDPTGKKLAILWLIPQLYISYLASHYFSYETSPFPLFYVVRTQNRGDWWYSKIVACAVHSGMFYICTLLIVIGVSRIGGQLPETVPLGGHTIQFGWFLLHVVGLFITTSAAVMAIQFWINLLFGAVISYILVILLYLSCFFIPNKWMLPIHSNLRAYGELAEGGFSYSFGYFFNIICFVTIIWLGYFYVKGLDILDKNDKK